MIRNFLPNDYSRCDNHACPLQMTCSRYQQLALDRRNGALNASVTVKRYSFKRDNNQLVDTTCEGYIYFTKEVG